MLCVFSSLPYFPPSIAHAQNPSCIFPSLLICHIFLVPLLYFCLCAAVKCTLPEFHTHKLVYWHAGAVAVIWMWTHALSVVCFYMGGFKLLLFLPYDFFHSLNFSRSIRKSWAVHQGFSLIQKEKVCWCKSTLNLTSSLWLFFPVIQVSTVNSTLYQKS